MNIYSYQARLKKINPRFRLRTRTPFVAFGSGMTITGLYRGFRYEGYAISGGWVEKNSQPSVYSHTYSEIQKKWLKRLVTMKRRGRMEFLRLMWGHRAIRTKAARQLLSL